MAHCCGGSPKEKTATQTFHVEGMSCSHCVMSIENAVSAVDGVDRVDVSLESGTVTVAGANVSRESIAQAIEKAGYTVS